MTGKYITISYQESSGAPSTIAGVKGDKLRVSGETIEVSNETNCDWKKFIAGRKEWDITTDYLVLTSSSIASDILRVGKTYTVCILAGGNSILRGQAICTETVQNYQNGALIKGSFTFKGTGALEEVINP